MEQDVHRSRRACFKVDDVVYVLGTFTSIADFNTIVNGREMTNPAVSNSSYCNVVEQKRMNIENDFHHKRWYLKICNNKKYWDIKK